MPHKLNLDEIRPAWVIASREVRDQFRDWRIIFPVFGLTLVFPFIMNWTARQILEFVNRYGATLISDRLVPFLLMIVGFFPISVSLVIALESFVGEKERGSIEPLLNTPLKDWQLYLGKLLAATVPPLVSSFLGMSVYLGGLAFNHIPWPEPMMLVQIIVLTVVQAVMMVAGAVVVSAQATSIRAANLLASFIIIPSAFLIQWEAVVMFWGNFDTLWWVVFGVLVLTILLVRIGLAHFRREELLGREIDVLRLAWSMKIFWNAFTGQAKTPMEWYRRVIAQTLRRLLLPSLLVFGIVIAGTWIGVTQADRFPFLINDEQMKNLDQGMGKLQEILPMLGARSFMLILWQNVRT
ncbi:MAG: ABC transporter permease subunit, partial [Anaerolineaceae bacterium]|nr:ABC transporter permease subunit [Anaerolineaceae bacterium]